jgi:glycosyltransferase involved in cell wall biosynthesis
MTVRATASETPSGLPLVSVIVPCRNERRYIADCLESIARNDYPVDRLEVLVVDGESTDGTRDVVADYSRRDSRIRLLDNPRCITPTALNIGIRAARGSVVMRMDAHCHYPVTYISQLVGWLDRSGADNVGGVCRTLPANESAPARGVALALAHPFGVGNARFRIGVHEPTWVDTVPFGCYRRSVFDTIGLFDEDLARNQDDEFNHRLVKHGGRILLVPDVHVDYFARASIGRLARMYYQYGFFKPLVIKKLGRILTLRQLAPPLFTAAIIATAALAPWSALAGITFAALALGYGGAAALAAAIGTSRDAGFRVKAALATAFPAIHLGYGLGFIAGVWQFWVLGRLPEKRASTLPLSR